MNRWFLCKDLSIVKEVSDDVVGWQEAKSLGEDYWVGYLDLNYDPPMICSCSCDPQIKFDE